MLSSDIKHKEKKKTDRDEKHTGKQTSLRNFIPMSENKSKVKTKQQLELTHRAVKLHSKSLANLDTAKNKYDNTYKREVYTKLTIT